VDCDFEVSLGDIVRLSQKPENTQLTEANWFGFPSRSSPIPYEAHQNSVLRKTIIQREPMVLATGRERKQQRFFP
jgi:hypothetical protein